MVALQSSTPQRLLLAGAATPGDFASELLAKQWCFAHQEKKMKL